MFLISLVAVACNAVLTSPRAILYNYPPPEPRTKNLRIELWCRNEHFKHKLESGKSRLCSLLDSRYSPLTLLSRCGQGALRHKDSPLDRLPQLLTFRLRKGTLGRHPGHRVVHGIFHQEVTGLVVPKRMTLRNS